MNVRRPLMLAAFLCLAGGLAPAQKSDTPAPAESGVVIQTETRLVLVDAVVTDKKNEYVHDLTLKDFKVWEDGKQQTIKNFSFEADPASPAASQKRYLVLFFDNSTMNSSDQVRARQAAGKFIDANTGPNRLMAIVNYGGALQIAQNFTDDAERLRSVVNGVKFSAVAPNATRLGTTPVLGSGSFNAASDFGARDMILALRNLAKNLNSIRGRKILVLLTAGFKVTQEQLSEVTATIDACNRADVAIYPIDVRGLVTAIPGVAFGRPGFPRNDKSPFRLAAFTPESTSMAFFQRGGAGGRGGGGAPSGGGQSGGAPGGAPGGASAGPVGTGGGRGAPTGGQPGQPGPGPGNPRMGTNPGGSNYPGNQGRGGGQQPGQFNPNNPFNPLNPYNQARELIPKIPESTVANQQVMYMLADGTGGFVIHDSNDLLAGLQKIAKEQNEYYLLGYTPPESKDGSCHVLRVKVDRGGVKVRARTGYCDAKPRDLLAGSPIEKSLETRAAAAQAGDVAASIQVPYFYTSPNVARVNVAMEIAPEHIKFEKQKGKFHAELDVLGIANTPDGGVGARFSDTVKLDFDDKKEIEAFQKHPLHYEDQFDVASGKYDLKVVFSSGGEDFGKLETPLVVDPYETQEFALSGLALSKTARRASDMGAELDASLIEDKKPLIADNVQIVPSGSSQFKKSDLAVFYFEVYEPLLENIDPQDPPAVAIDMRILDRKTGEAKKDTGMMKLELPKTGGNPIIPVAEKIPVDNLGPGSYVLELTAEDTAGKGYKRTVDFDLQ